MRKTFAKENPNMVNFILIKFSSYVENDNVFYIPGEIGATAFSIQNGITDNFSTLIDTGKMQALFYFMYETLNFYSFLKNLSCFFILGDIPIGYGFTARDNANKLWLPYPPFDNRLQNYKILMAKLESFVENVSFYKSQKNKIVSNSYCFFRILFHHREKERNCSSIVCLKI
jgi:hypothetical protein